MKATWKIWAAAAMVAAGLFPLGCGSVEISGQPAGCPTAVPGVNAKCDVTVEGCAYQDGPCNVTFSCDAAIGAWQSTAVSCVPAAKDCWSAADGDVCEVVGESCGEGSGPCGGSFFNDCGADHHWHTTSDAGGGDDCCPQSDPCPAAQPLEGDFCEPCLGPPSCSYASGCGGSTVATCGPDATWQIAYEDCPPPPSDYCTANGTQAICETDPGCRWLTPGCGTPALAAPGCFTTTECAPGSCQPGTTCQTVSYDPCFNKGCDACSADTNLCLYAGL